jgi:hypothetical protein
MRLTPYLTPGYDEIITYQIRATRPGQAHFANTGPFGATCKECVFYGYFRKFLNDSGDTVGTKYRSGCAKYLQLTGKHGPLLCVEC